MVTLFLLAVRYIHPRSPLPRQILGHSEKYPALVSGLRPAQLRCVYGCRILCPGCFLYQFRNALVQGSFPLILSFQGISSFLHIFITQRQQDICLYTSQFAAFHPVLTGSFFYLLFFYVPAHAHNTICSPLENALFLHHRLQPIL